MRYSSPLRSELKMLLSSKLFFAYSKNINNKMSKTKICLFSFVILCYEKNCEPFKKKCFHSNVISFKFNMKINQNSKTVQGKNGASTLKYVHCVKKNFIHATRLSRTSSDSWYRS